MQSLYNRTLPDWATNEMVDQVVHGWWPSKLYLANPHKCRFTGGKYIMIVCSESYTTSLYLQEIYKNNNL